MKFIRKHTLDWISVSMSGHERVNVELEMRNLFITSDDVCHARISCLSTCIPYILRVCVCYQNVGRDRVWNVRLNDSHYGGSNLTHLVSSLLFR